MSRSSTSNANAPSASLWLVDGARISDGELQFFAQRLDAGEADRYARFIRPERQRQFLIGRILLRFAASRLLHLPPAAIGVIEVPGSVPRIVAPGSDCPPPHFSLSHSRDWVACAISDEAALGLDIEVVDPQRDILALSDAAFHADEHAWLQAQPDGARVAAFYRLWSLRESLYKMKSNAGSDPVLPLLVDAHGEPVLQGRDWQSYTVPHADLSCVLCSNQSLSAIVAIEPVSLAEAAWTVASH